MHASRQSWFDNSEGVPAPSFGTGTLPRLANVDNPGTGADGTPPDPQRSTRRRPSQLGSNLNPVRETSGDKTHCTVAAAVDFAFLPCVGQLAGEISLVTC